MRVDSWRPTTPSGVVRNPDRACPVARLEGGAVIAGGVRQPKRSHDIRGVG